MMGYFFCIRKAKLPRKTSRMNFIGLFQFQFFYYCYLDFGIFMFISFFLDFNFNQKGLCNSFINFLLVYYLQNEFDLFQFFSLSMDLFLLSPILVDDILPIFSALFWTNIFYLTFLYLFKKTYFNVFITATTFFWNFSQFSPYKMPFQRMIYGFQMLVLRAPTGWWSMTHQASNHLKLCFLIRKVISRIFLGGGISHPPFLDVSPSVCQHINLGREKEYPTLNFFSIYPLIKF